MAARPAAAHVWSDAVRVPAGGLIQHTIRLSNIGGGQAVGVRVRDDVTLRWDGGAMRHDVRVTVRR
ncbi:MAG TPA: hypothetical protein VFL87_08185 [Thermoleophilaceae bacterium]|nr:hypothetical protein [Thermoleophilaceae bacterium]